MRSLRTLFLISFVAASVAGSANARQLGGLLKRAKERAENKVEQLAERQVDKTVDNLVEDMWNGAAGAIGSALESALPKAKTTVDPDGKTVHQEGLPDIPINENADAPLDAEYVSYITVSEIKLPGQLAALADRLGNATVEEVYLHGSRKLSGDAETGVLIDQEAKRFSYLDRTASTFWSTTYEEMFQMAQGAMDKVKENMGQMPAQPAQAANQMQMDATVNVIKGARKTVRGLDAAQNIITVQTQMQNPDAEEESGAIWVVMELWSAESYGGSGTIAAFDAAVGKDIVDAMGGSGLDSKLDMGAFGDARMMKGMQEAQEKMGDMAGLPVEANTYFVMTGKDEILNVPSILEGKSSDTQIIMMTMKSFVANLSTDPFDPSKVTIPDSYKEVESPLKMFMGGNSGN